MVGERVRFQQPLFDADFRDVLENLHDFLHLIVRYFVCRKQEIGKPIDEQRIDFHGTHIRTAILGLDERLHTVVDEGDSFVRGERATDADHIFLALLIFRKDA